MQKLTELMVLDLSDSTSLSSIKDKHLLPKMALHTINLLGCPRLKNLFSVEILKALELLTELPSLRRWLNQNEIEVDDVDSKFNLHFPPGEVGDIDGYIMDSASPAPPTLSILEEMLSTSRLASKARALDLLLNLGVHAQLLELLVADDDSTIEEEYSQQPS
ncbi:hypothetical protein POM88_009032 [Heracleum sosnowskyi]|uniref:Uncharacterized protein n=1 Tax=Heracleum sosnowskyi TaxID=360622 RepID=A0AAD8N718_9APIA|nr:hypothetical protein POM88_009032 [Heracleum sosnowskyi]